MRNRIAARLLDLNREFYQTFGGEFAETRARLQPGVLRAVSAVSPQAVVLDLGCGHGGLAVELARRGHPGGYLGLDGDPGFIRRAQSLGLPGRFGFAVADLSAAGWQGGLCGPFDEVFLLAVLHHLPGAARRRALLGQVRRLIPAGGRLVLSVWDFRASSRLRRRVVPWAAVGLDDSQVEPGDVLLDWRRGGTGLRYVHHFAAAELTRLARASGFIVRQSYRSDGEGGRLGLYQAWQAAPL